MQKNMNPIYKSPLLSADWLNQISKFIGKFLYYVCGVDNTCLLLLIVMSPRIEPTKQDENNKNQFLDYIETHPDAVVWFHASDMILRADTDSSYLTKPQACSRDAGCFFLGSTP